MPKYILPHTIPQEDRRLTLMSCILDPCTFFRLEQTGIGEGWKCLEVGAGNGSVSHWLCDKVGNSGHVVSADIETNFLESLDLPNLEVRKLDIVKEPVDDSAYDLVFARALLHHLPARFEVITKLAGAVKPGGFLLLVEPDIHPALCADSPAWRGFWEGFLGWADMKGVDYFIGRKVPTKLRELGFDDVQSHGETIIYNGNSDAAEYYRLFIEEVGSQSVEAGSVTQNQIEEVTALLKNPNFWAMNFCFVATSGRKPGT